MAPRIGTVALAVRFEKGQPVLVDQFSDEREIEALESALSSQEQQPLEMVYGLRTRQQQEDEEFGDYIEELLSRPYVRPEVQEHGVQWLKSKIKIEQFQRSEREASKIIAEYAFRVFTEDKSRTDFILEGPQARVRIRILVLNPETESAGRSKAA